MRFMIWSRERQLAPHPNGPRFFLWRIVGNLTIDLVRRNRILGALISLDDIANSVADPYPTADRSLEAKQQYLLLKSALDELPARHRAALLLEPDRGIDPRRNRHPSWRVGQHGIQIYHGRARALPGSPFERPALDLIELR